MNTTTLVIPCYNEETRLDLDAFDEALRGRSDIRLLFVDDGSTDRTARRIADYIERVGDDRAQLLSLSINSGKAEAVRCGLLQAIRDGASIVGFWDADLATPLEAIFDLLGVLSRRPDIDWVLGARVQLLGRDIQRRALRHYLGRVFATAASIVLSMPVYDTQCGAKLFRVTEELREVLSWRFVSRWVFDVEMISRFAKIRMRDRRAPAVKSIFEYPLQRWTDVAGSKVRSGDFIKASVELLQIWRAQLPRPESQLEREQP